MTDHTPMQLEKYYTCYIERTLYTLQPSFCKVDYRLVNIECPNSTKDNIYNIDDGSGGSDVGM